MEEGKVALFELDLKDLEPDAAIKAFFEGFGGKDWTSEDWNKKVFQKDRAAKEFCRLKEDDFARKKDKRMSINANGTFSRDLDSSFMMKSGPLGLS